MGSNESHHQHGDVHLKGIASNGLKLKEERLFYDFDLERDNLMTYLRMAGENAHRFFQEQYFADTLLEKDEASLAQVV
jgi:hypothetical protein